MSYNAATRLITFRACALRAVQKDEWITLELLAHDPNDITRVHQQRSGLPHAAFALQTRRAQPQISQRKPFAAVIVLEVIHSHRHVVLHDRAMLRNFVRHPREHFTKMNCGVRIVSNAKQQYLRVEFLCTADWTLEPVWRLWQRVRRDQLGVRAERGKGERVCAAMRARNSPKDIRRRAKARVFRRFGWVEGRVVVVTPRWHDDGSLIAYRGAKRFDNAKRTTLHWTNGAIRHVNDKHAALAYAKRAKLAGKVSWVVHWRAALLGPPSQTAYNSCRTRT